MAVEVRMPAYSESMEEADVVGWLVRPGDRVDKGDPIAEIETDKATGELESPASGVLSQILIAEGSQGVKVGDLLALIEPAEEAELETPGRSSEPVLDLDSESESPLESVPPSKAHAESEPSDGAKPASSESQGPPPTQPIQPAVQAASDSTREGTLLPASALARRIADRAGLDLSTIEGSGPSGRILKADVVSVSPRLGETRADASQAQQPSTPPQLRLLTECRAERAKATCEGVSALEPDAAIPLLALIVRAAAGALREVPEANAIWVAGELTSQADNVVALGLSAGHERPPAQLYDADRKGLGVLAAEIAATAPQQAPSSSPRAAALSLVHVGDANIESIQLTALPPGVCVLGTGAITERAIAEGGELSVAEMMTCTLAADARAIEAQSAARLLAAFKRRFEDPLEMILS